MISDTPDRFEDQQVLDCGLLPSREGLPKAADLFVLAHRVAVWESIQMALELAEIHEASHFRLESQEADENSSEATWALQLKLNGVWFGRGQDPQMTQRTEDEPDLINDLDSWYQDMGGDLRLPQRVEQVISGDGLRTDQGQDIQDLIFGEGMVARWREQRTPVFNEAAVAIPMAARKRHRP